MAANDPWGASDSGESSAGIDGGAGGGTGMLLGGVGAAGGAGADCGGGG